MRVLVTGGAGYVGSFSVRELLEAGHDVTVLDDLSNGHVEAVDTRARFVHGNTGDRQVIAGLLASGSIEAVMHLASSDEAAESQRDPQRCYRTNLVNTLELLQAMRMTGVRRLVVSSTAAVYGSPARVPVEETEPANPVTPYARSKLMTEWLLRDFSSAYRIGFAVLRHFGVAGGAPDGALGEDHHPETHLIPLILGSVLEGSGVRVFGTDYPTPDGTCVRDYVHVADVARAHRLALERVMPGDSFLFNVGGEKGYSVRDVIAACERVTGRKLTVVEDARRPGDAAALVASSRRIRDLLGWERQFPGLDTIVEHAWLWQRKHPQGYAGARKRGLEARPAS